MKKLLPLLVLIGVLIFLTRSKTKGKASSGPTGIPGSGGGNASSSFKAAASSQPQHVSSGAVTLRPSTAGISIPNSKANQILQQIANAQRAQRNFGGGGKPNYSTGSGKKPDSSPASEDLNPQGDSTNDAEFTDPTDYNDTGLNPQGDSTSDAEFTDPSDFSDIQDLNAEGGDNAGDFGGSGSDFGGDGSGDFGGDSPDVVGFTDGIDAGSW